MRTAPSTTDDELDADDIRLINAGYAGCTLSLGECGICLPYHIATDLAPIQIKEKMMAKITGKKNTEPDLLEGEVPTYDQIGLDDEFVSLVSRKNKISAKMKALEIEETEIKEQLLAIVESSLPKGVKAVDVEGYRVSYSEGAVKRTLDPKLLLKNGVSAKIIAKSTTETQGKPYVSVRPVKVKD